MSEVPAEATSSERYSVVVSGKIAEGFELSQVKASVGTLFKLDEGRVEKLFSGKPVAIRRGVEKASALKLRSALAKVGAIAVIKVARATAEAVTNNTQPSEKRVEVEAAKPFDKLTPDISCPRCGHEQPFITACGLCKMDLALHIQRLKRKQQMRDFRQQQAS
ncbi:MAG TPA: hypothetical protein ENI05_12885 [Porticoccus sp.]|nr:hypothetical protein [Porticoccus sp.]